MQSRPEVSDVDDRKAKKARTATSVEEGILNIIVTGGSSGIGSATVLDLLRSGHRVFATGRDPAAFGKLEHERAALLLTGSLQTSIGNVSHEPDVSRQMEEALTFFGDRLDGVVLNAGCGAGKKLAEEVPLDVFDQVFQTNVRGTFIWIQQALCVMKRQGRGQIVVTSSVAASRPCPYSVVYASSKCAVQGMVSSLRAELKGTGIKIGTVNPGPVATDWWNSCSRGGYNWKPKDAFENKEKLAFWNSMLDPHDVAKTIISMLEQPASSNIESIMMDSSDHGGISPP